MKFSHFEAGSSDIQLRVATLISTASFLTSSAIIENIFPHESLSPPHLAFLPLRNDCAFLNVVSLLRGDLQSGRRGVRAKNEKLDLLSIAMEFNLRIQKGFLSHSVSVITFD